MPLVELTVWGRGALAKRAHRSRGKRGATAGTAARCQRVVETGCVRTIWEAAGRGWMQTKRSPYHRAVERARGRPIGMPQVDRDPLPTHEYSDESPSGNRFNPRCRSGGRGRRFYLREINIGASYRPAAGVVMAETGGRLTVVSQEKRFLLSMGARPVGQLFGCDPKRGNWLMKPDRPGAAVAGASATPLLRQPATRARGCAGPRQGATMPVGVWRIGAPVADPTVLRTVGGGWAEASPAGDGFGGATAPLRLRPAPSPGCGAPRR